MEVFENVNITAANAKGLSGRLSDLLATPGITEVWMPRNDPLFATIDGSDVEGLVGLKGVQDLVQGTGARQGTIAAAAFGAYDGLDLDGSDDCYPASPVWQPDLTDNFTLVFFGETPASGVLMGLIGRYQDSTNNACLYVTSGGSVQAKWCATDLTLGAHGGDPFLAVLAKTGSTIYGQLNGGLPVTGAASGTFSTTANFVIGALAPTTPTSPYDGLFKFGAAAIGANLLTTPGGMRPIYDYLDGVYGTNFG